MATPTRDQLLEELRGLKAGIEKNLARTSFLVGAKTWTGHEAAAFVDQCIAVVHAVSAAKSQVTDAVQNERQFMAVNGATLRSLRDILRLMYAGSDETLREFSLKARKVRKTMTTETLLLRAAKARATRAKRRTMGKRQKAKIKGDVTGVVIEPIRQGAATEAPVPPKDESGGSQGS